MDASTPLIPTEQPLARLSWWHAPLGLLIAAGCQIALFIVLVVWDLAQGAGSPTVDWVNLADPKVGNPLLTLGVTALTWLSATLVAPRALAAMVRQMAGPAGQERFWSTLGGGVLMLVAIGAMAQFTGAPGQDAAMLLGRGLTEADTAGALLIGVLVAVLIPIGEELFFRGVLLTGLRNRWGWGFGMLVSALLFGLAHWNSADPLYYVALTGTLGLVFAWAYRRTGNLRAAVALHALQNIAAILVLAVR